MLKLHSIMFTAALLAIGGIVIADEKQQSLMLQSEDNARCYVDFYNPIKTPAADFVAIFDHDYPIKRAMRPNPSLEIALIRDGKIVSINKPVSKIGPNEKVIVTKLRGWLGQHTAVGQRLEIVEEMPFKPNIYSQPLDMVDTPIAKNNQLAVYTPKMGSKTPPSIFRRELIVKNGRIIARGGGSSTIPSDGFVVSGHLHRTIWLSRLGIIGAKVTYTPNRVFITIDPKTWFLHAQHYLDLLSRRSPAQKKNLPDYHGKIGKLQQQLQQAREIEKTNPRQSWQQVKDILKQSKELLYTTTQSPAEEIRGAYLPGIIRDKKILQQYAERMQQAGFNVVIPLFRAPVTKEKIAELNRFSKVMKAHGIDTVIWTFLPVANLMNEDTGSIVKKHPDWKDIDRTGKRTGLDLTQPKVMDACCKALQNLCRQAEITGILFDYEGYRGGYSQHSQRTFAKTHGLNPDKFDATKLTAGNGKLFQQWRQWRKKHLIDAGHRLATAARAANPDIQIIGCVTALDYSPGLVGTETLHMVWPEWIKRNTFDVVTTMAYAQNTQWVKDTSRKTVNIIKKGTKVIPSLILYPETGGSVPIEPELLIDQVEAIREAGCQGAYFFLADQIMPFQGPAGEDLFNCMKKGLFRSTSTSSEHQKK